MPLLVQMFSRMCRKSSKEYKRLLTTTTIYLYHLPRHICPSFSLTPPPSLSSPLPSPLVLLLPLPPPLTCLPLLQYPLLHV